MRTVSILLLSAGLVACSQVQPISDAEQAEIDCLASITVVEITDAIRDATAAGTDASELRDIPGQKIGEAKEKLKAKYDGRMDSAFLEFDINNRLEKIQDALSNRDPDSLATVMMEETFELGRSCTFGG